MLRYGKAGDVSIDELDSKMGVNRRVGGGNRRNEGPGVVSSRAGIRRGRARVGGGGLGMEESFLTLGNVASNGRKSI